MVFIRQASPSQEARWTLAPRGIRPPPRSHKPSAEFTGSREVGSAATMGDSGSHVKGTVGLVFRLLTWVWNPLPSHTPPVKLEMGVGMIFSGKSLWSIIHLFALRETSWKCIPTFSTPTALASHQKGAGVRTEMDDSLLKWEGHV